MRSSLLILHILGGSISLIAGTAEMIARKGNRVNRLYGKIFTISMLTLAMSGSWLAILRSQTSTSSRLS